MNDWFIRIMMLVTVTFIFYFIALGKNVSKTEKENKRDMSYEINPFTGMKMPSEDKEDEKSENDNKVEKRRL